MAIKTNVVRTSWKVVTKEVGGYHKKEYLVMAESEETARLKVPKDEEVLSVTPIDGRS